MTDPATRLLTTVALVASALAWGQGVAAAGGSWMTADRYEVGPGDVVALEGEAHPGQLGWVEDGPFQLALRPAGEAYGFGRRTGDVPLGSLRLDRVGISLRVTATVTIPSVPPGEYDVVYCDRTCSGGLGDLIGLDRSLRVASVAGDATPTDRTSGHPPVATLVAAAGGVLLLAGVRWVTAPTGRRPGS